LRRSATVRVAGRTLGQLLVPFEYTVAPHRRGDKFGAATATAPPAQPIDPSVYAYDAADPVLP
jgi:hypothetical protein